MNSQNQKPQLWALLVAINDYPSPVPSLQGCVNDLQKIKAYLQKESFHFDVHTKILVNEKATKANIVAQFKNYIGQASGGDVAFFYYSGHGTQEQADSIFWPIEEDRKHEALVCFDSYINQNGKVKVNLLADKELRYLIHQLEPKGAHLITIFDCCHSGGNTRNGYISDSTEDVREKRFVNRNRLSQAFPAREWKDFIFSDVITYETAQNQTILQVLPEGKHIQMAACQNDQSAFEVKGEGVFTKNLVDVLTRCGGAVTYYDLQSRIQQYLKNQFDQTPRIYVVGDTESALFQGFLCRKIEYAPLYGNINYNSALGWIMDMGAMHGIPPNSPSLKVLTLNGEKAYSAKIRQVFSTYTLIIFEEEQPDTSTSYKGYLTDYFSHPLGIFLNIQNEELKEKLLQLISAVNPNLYIMEKDYKADFCIQYTDERLYLSRPGTPAVPVVKPREYTSDNDLHILQNYLVHLSQFEFIKNLHNTNTYLFRKDPVEVRVFRQSLVQEVPVKIMQGELIFDFNQTERSKWSGSIRIVLKNTSDRKLYCTLWYLSFHFGVNVKLLKEVVVGLEPNREVWALDGAPIGLVLEEEITKYNYPESVSYLKLIVSTTDFKQQATRFEMPPLPGPLTPAIKGFEFGSDAYDPGNIEDWTTRLITVKVKNPMYNPV